MRFTAAKKGSGLTSQGEEEKEKEKEKEKECKKVSAHGEDVCRLSGEAPLRASTLAASVSFD